MERPAARFWSVWRARGGRPAPAEGAGGTVRAGWRTDTAAAGEPPGPCWLAVLHLGGAHALDLSYHVDPPLVIGAPLPRIAVRSEPAGPAFSLDLRQSTPASPLYVGALRFTDSRSRSGRIRVAGTWSAPTTTFCGTGVGAAGQRGTVRVVLRLQ